MSSRECGPPLELVSLEDVRVELLLRLEPPQTRLEAALELRLGTDVDHRVDDAAQTADLGCVLLADLVAREDQVALLAEEVQQAVQSREELADGFVVVLEVVADDVREGFEGAAEDLDVVDGALFEQLDQRDEEVSAGLGLFEVLRERLLPCRSRRSL